MHPFSTFKSRLEIKNKSEDKNRKLCHYKNYGILKCSFRLLVKNEEQFDQTNSTSREWKSASAVKSIKPERDNWYETITSFQIISYNVSASEINEHDSGYEHVPFDIQQE